MTKLVLDGVGNLQQQISRAFRSAIELGTLPPNSRLSPTRVFAEEHKVSRNTVTAAYDQLCAEGYLHARQGSGTFVADINFDVSDDTQRDGVALEPRWSAAVKRAQTRVPDVLVSREFAVDCGLIFYMESPAIKIYPSTDGQEQLVAAPGN